MDSKGNLYRLLNTGPRKRPVMALVEFRSLLTGLPALAVALFLVGFGVERVILV